jgi:hypothetical protein
MSVIPPRTPPMMGAICTLLGIAAGDTVAGVAADEEDVLARLTVEEALKLTVMVEATVIGERVVLVENTVYPGGVAKSACVPL